MWEIVVREKWSLAVGLCMAMMEDWERGGTRARGRQHYGAHVVSRPHAVFRTEFFDAQHYNKTFYQQGSQIQYKHSLKCVS